VQTATLFPVAQDQGRLQFPPWRNLAQPRHRGRIVKWSVELGEFDLKFYPRQAIKSQILTDFVYK
jgi:hypothetical protein